MNIPREPAMSADNPADCTFETVMAFLLPFFLTGTGGNPDIARATITRLLNSYRATTPSEHDLVGRIVGFSVAALDNLRLSMTPNLSDAKLLRYRTNAVTLSRASDQAKKMLEASQAQQPAKTDVPRPSVAAAPPPSVQPPSVRPPPAQQATRASHPPAPPRAPAPGTATTALPPLDIDTMKRDARIMMQAFSKNGAQTSILTHIPDPATAVKAAARAAVQASVRSPNT